MDGLRWILLLLGAAIVAGIYFYGSRKEAQAKLRDTLEGDLDHDHDELPESDSGEGSAAPLDQSLERELAKLGQLIAEDRSRDGLSDGVPDGLSGEPAGTDVGGLAAKDPQAQTSANAGAAIKGESVELPDNPEKIITLLLRGAGTARLLGTDIADAADKVGLTFGDRGIYHRMVDRGEQPVAVFSMANITNPGTFDMQAMATTFTPGLCLFLTLPNSLSALDSWDVMYAAGQRLADLLECSLLDESGSSLTRQTVAHIRDELREYDRGSDYPPIH